MVQSPSDSPKFGRIDSAIYREARYAGKVSSDTGCSFARPRAEVIRIRCFTLDMIESHMRAAVNGTADSLCHVHARFRGPESASGYPARVGGSKIFFIAAGRCQMVSLAPGSQGTK